jgi:hypothetical protein
MKKVCDFLYVKHRESVWWLLTIIYVGSVFSVFLLHARPYYIISMVVGSVIYMGYMIGMIAYEGKDDGKVLSGNHQR